MQGGDPRTPPSPVSSIDKFGSYGAMNGASSATSSRKPSSVKPMTADRCRKMFRIVSRRSEPPAAGNALARQGDWRVAEEKWKAAKDANPGNHAALHNLALAAETRQNYREAFTLLDQALDQLPLKLYHQTRRAMEKRQTTFLAAAKQVEAIRAAALAHAGPPGLPAILPANYQSRESLDSAANQ